VASAEASWRRATAVWTLVLMGALGEALCGYLIVGRPALTSELADALVATVVNGWRIEATA